MKKLVTINKDGNPYYGKAAALAMLQTLSQEGVPQRTVNQILNAAWKETQNERDLFYTIFFSIGDVSDRIHYLFGGSRHVEKGGEGNRKNFVYMLMWLHENQKDAFYHFLPLITEYSVIENVMFYQNTTDRKKGTLLETRHIPVDVDKLTDFIASEIKNRPEMAFLWAKFLSRPRFSTRQRKASDNKRRELKKHTVDRMRFKAHIISLLSKKMGWEVKKHANNTQYVGFNRWKKQHNRLHESVMFSEQNISSMSRSDFFEWLNNLPSGARYRVQRRLFDHKSEPIAKWTAKDGTPLATLFTQWEDLKKDAQAEVRKLEERAAQGEQIDVTDLAKAKAAAKVNTGAENIQSLFLTLLQAMRSGQEPKSVQVLADALLAKVKLEVPVLVVADISGSMTMRGRESHGFTSASWRDLIATLVLTKNPIDAPFMLAFGSTTTLLGRNLESQVRDNKFTMPKTKFQKGDLVNRENSFIDNWQSVSRTLSGMSGSTNLRSVAEFFDSWMKLVPEELELRREMIQQYQVILVISDGDINTTGNPTTSVLAAQHALRQLGWDGVIVLWNVSDAVQKTNYYDGLENVIHYTGGSPNVLSTIFEKIHDLELVDIYTQLQSLMRNNRYDPVRDVVKSFEKIRTAAVK